MSDSTIKLYLVTTRGWGDYSKFYVAAINSDIAYRRVREYLDNNNLMFSRDRELKSVELLAEQTSCPKCKTMFLVTGESTPAPYPVM